jgi:hypothetical protein
MFRDRPNRVLDRQCETFSQLRADVVTMPALPANPRLLPGSIRPVVSGFLKQALSDLLPRDDIGRILFMPRDSII